MNPISVDEAAPAVVAPAASARPVIAAVLMLVAVSAVSAGQLVWTANALLRDEERFAHVVHGTLIREPVRGEAAAGLATDLADTAFEALRNSPGPAPGPAGRAELNAVAMKVVAGPAFDEQLEPIVDAVAAWAVSGRKDTAALETVVVWGAYKAELSQTRPELAERLEALPTPDEVREHLAAETQEAVPEPGGTQGLRVQLRWLPLGVLLCYAVALAAAVGAVMVGRSSGRIIAAAILLPALVTAAAWALSTGPGSWMFLLRAATRAALPGCALTAMVALAALLIGTRRPMSVAPVGPPRAGPRSG